MKAPDMHQILLTRQFTGFRRLLFDGGNIKRIVDYRQSVRVDRQVLLQIFTDGF
ncbi:hypothetical protein D3C80_1695660 [compost metagenome]